MEEKNDSTIKCNSCEIEYRADDYKFVADQEGRGGYYQKRKNPMGKSSRNFSK